MTTGCERVLARLRQGPATHHDLYALHVVCHSRVSELRRRGHLIECERTTDQRGERLYTYRLKTASGAGGSVHLPALPGASSDAVLSLHGSQGAGGTNGGTPTTNGQMEPPVRVTVAPADPRQVDPGTAPHQLTLTDAAA